KKIYKLGALIVALFALGFITLSVQDAQAADKEVSLSITAGSNTCTFGNYNPMTSPASYTTGVVVSNQPSYECTLLAGQQDGGQANTVTVQSTNLTGSWAATRHIPAANVKLKHVNAPIVRSGACQITTYLSTGYTNVASTQTLIKKDELTICTIGSSTQIQITIPASLPVGTYSGYMIFTEPA
ncbi:MAG TPA: hypothetical protein PKX34_03915, partial [Candidatus Absconditabacterales bacterium]|nr:hypothetical protein [Candidatus Absconditabacterales bacterium]HPK28324.1 hypothetical protein [Candidatus Absconditabacterales bacterium]